MQVAQGLQHRVAKAAGIINRFEGAADTLQGVVDEFKGFGSG